ncbi:MAG: NADH-quinone oxidoreductase subunit N [Sedimentisphaerales bacterium]|jgi:NADH-quinone oxidoreductase subunit N
MSPNDLITILPLLVLAGGIVLIMLVLTVLRNHALTMVLAVLTLAIATATLPVSPSIQSRQITPLLVFDSYAMLYMIMVFGAAIVVCVLSYGYMSGRQNIKEEFYILILMAALGCGVIVAASHFVSFFLGLELLSVSLYVLVAYLRAQPIHIEAGIKYLIPAATSVAFLLMGAAFIYAYCGSMNFSEIVFSPAYASTARSPLLLVGIAMVVVGIGFKLALVPFHLWTPDVYEGAPAPVAGFIATASKGAIFALLLRYFTVVNIYDCRSLFVVFVILAIITMFFGNLLALLQNNVKRILAYSSIAHMGYLLTALLAGGKWAAVAVTLYLLTYFVTTLGAFGVITILSSKEKDFDMLDNYRGLVFQHPVLVAVFTGFLLSLAGIPLTAGFIGKFYIFSANVDASMWLLLAALVINSVIGLFYYLRIIVTLYKPTEEPQAALVSQFRPAPSFSFAGGLVLAMLMLFLLWIGVYPSPFIDLVRDMVSGLI